VNSEQEEDEVQFGSVVLEGASRAHYSQAGPPNEKEEEEDEEYFFLASTTISSAGLLGAGSTSCHNRGKCGRAAKAPEQPTVVPV